MLGPNDFTGNNGAMRKLQGAAGPDNNGGFPAPPYLQYRPPQMGGSKPAISQGATGPTDVVKPSTQQSGGLQRFDGPMVNAKSPGAAAASSGPQSAPPPLSAPPPGSDGQSPPPVAQPGGIEAFNGGMVNMNAPAGAPGGQPAGGAAMPNAENPYSLKNLGGQIEKQLANPSAFNADVVKQAYGYMKGDLEKQRDVGLANADTDAASRGVYYGTPGLLSRERVTTDYNRGLGGLASSLATAQASQYGQDRQMAMNNAFNFLGNANQQDMQDQQLAALASELGMQGAPSYGTAVGMPMPNPNYGGLDPQALQALGGLLAGNGNNNGKKKQAPPATEDNTNNVG